MQPTSLLTAEAEVPLIYTSFSEPVAVVLRLVLILNPLYIEQDVTVQGTAANVAQENISRVLITGENQS